ncbi:helix-turn-helix domain-containing protein [Paraburkholderia sp.]|uniref:helix-turn-helix domain-containing protein n=1 Tax=Paraburkholderia sp. TaxID=1926495 RepID=UPI0023981629|nr:helix-turn-helix domain-containing protein [Paraburkholderia sp.]MDE1181500.1 helix-turn-helix domain-containing protein [Paraburkholderia sp.]
MATNIVRKPALDLEGIVNRLKENPDVAKFSVEVDKRHGGVVRVSASQTDGFVKTQTLLGKGLKQLSVFDPSAVTKQERRELIGTLHDSGKGMTQNEIATTLGVSQSLVSLELRKLKSQID